MSGVDRALARNPFSVDQTQCYLAAEALKNFSPAEETYPWSGTPVVSQVTFKLLFVTICHQINWDFLQRRMFERFFSTDEREMLAVAKDAKPSMISEMLSGYHREERIRASERARYLRETALAVASEFDGDPMSLVSDRRIFGDRGLLKQLAKIPAFNEDPLAKKSNAFAQELARERIVEFCDADSIPPAIDYHLIRLYLRTGRVVPINQHVLNSLKTGTTHRMRLVKLLRERVSEALTMTAAFAKIPVHEINYVEWQIARNRCEKDFTNCDDEWPLELLDSSVSGLSVGCPLRHSCTAYSNPEWKVIIEPELKKSFY